MLSQGNNDEKLTAEEQSAKDEVVRRRVAQFFAEEGIASDVDRNVNLDDESESEEEEEEEVPSPLPPFCTVKDASCVPRLVTMHFSQLGRGIYDHQASLTDLCVAAAASTLRPACHSCNTGKRWH